MYAGREAGAQDARAVRSEREEMRTRRNKIEKMEDDFADLTLVQQASLMQVFAGLHRQKARNGAPLVEKKPPAMEPMAMFGGTPK